MKKSIIVVLALLVATLMAAPGNFTIKKLPAGSTPAIDGNIDEWNNSYFIDSLTGPNCVFAMDDPQWTGADIQIGVYAAWDDLNVYFAMKTIHDNINFSCGSSTAYTSGCDNMKVNPGGQAAAFYVYSNNDVFRNPSNPWQLQADLFAAADATGNGTLPTYEFSVSRAVLDQFDLRSFQLCVGSEDEDSGVMGSGANECYVGVGVEFTGNKTQYSNQWDNPLYYPTWSLSEDVIGDPISGAVEANPVRLAAERLSASPNPFMPSTVISYNVRNNGTLKIYDVNGKVAQSFVTKAGANKVQWNGTDMNGKSLSSGIYIARLVSGNTVLNRQLFLTR